MSEKEELLKRLSSLSDQGFLKYLIKTGYCMREAWDLYVNTWDDNAVREELNFLQKENIGTIDNTDKL